MSQACQQAHLFEQIPAYLRLLFDGQGRRWLGPAESVQLLGGHPACYVELGVRHARRTELPLLRIFSHVHLSARKGHWYP